MASFGMTALVIATGGTKHIDCSRNQSNLTRQRKIGFNSRISNFRKAGLI